MQRHIMEFEPEYRQKMLEKRHLMAPDPDFQGPSPQTIAWILAIVFLLISFVHLAQEG